MEFKATGYKFAEDDKCYEIENVKVTEENMAGAPWTMTWSLACISIGLAIIAVIWLGFRLWRFFKVMEERIEILEYEAKGQNIRANSLAFRIVTAERFSDNLWEAVVMNGGFRRREQGDLPQDQREEVLIREDENRLDFEAGRSRERRELMEASSPNRYDTPRGGRGIWSGVHQIEEGSEEESHETVGAVGTRDEEEVRYGAPTTEDEPEPHDILTEGEEPMSNSIEEQLDELSQQARRLRALLRHEEALLEMAYSQGEFEDAERIEANINHLEGLLATLPSPDS